MKDTYTIKLKCATCGCDDQFEFNEDKSYIKCTFCNREYLGGIEELRELNANLIQEVKEEIELDAMNHIQNELKKAFKGNKFVKLK